MARISYSPYQLEAKASFSCPHNSPLRGSTGPRSPHCPWLTREHANPCQGPYMGNSCCHCRHIPGGPPGVGMLSPRAERQPCFPSSPPHLWLLTLLLKSKPAHTLWPVVRNLDGILEAGVVPETPSSGPSTFCSNSPSLLYSGLSALGCSSPCPPLGSLSSGKGSWSPGGAPSTCRAWAPGGRQDGGGRNETSTHLPVARKVSLTESYISPCFFSKLATQGRVEMTMSEAPGRAQSPLASSWPELWLDLGGGGEGRWCCFPQSSA